MALNADVGLEHDCSDFTDDDDDGCSACWETAGDIVRAAEGLRVCPRCNGTGDTGGETGSVCCDDCGGDGLEQEPTGGEG